jgi:hypothetical protein
LPGMHHWEYGQAEEVKLIFDWVVHQKTNSSEIAKAILRIVKIEGIAAWVREIWLL